MNNLIFQVLRSAIIGIAVLLALIFVPAGTIDYWQGWAYGCLYHHVVGIHHLHGSLRSRAVTSPHAGGTVA